MNTLDEPAVATHTEPAGSSHSHKFSPALALIALGIVFGDIGTSPLYAFDAVFAHGMAITPLHVYGPLALIFWGLMLPITVKYVALALRINSEGEGGVFALYRILREHPHQKRSTATVATLLIFGAGLLYADGIITPAISVSSAIEGLNSIHPVFLKLSQPITIVILTLLFALQRKGTAVVGRFFGFATLLWFLSIGTLGLMSIVHHPEVWLGLNPLYAVKFLTTLTLFQRFVVLGYVMLAYTGGEALYADLGHVGAPAIRVCWLGLVYPCLTLNYFGQGAYLLGGGHYDPARSLFFAITPHPLVIPMVVLGAVATCIASQALITGAASLTALANGLHLMPRMKILHTNAEHKGQIYLPFLNGILWVACVAIVLYFKTSSNMANAYGLAVAGVMLITSIALLQLAPSKLGWSHTKSVIVFGSFAVFDGAMLISNTFKIVDGGFIPITVGLLLFLMMKIWQRGRRLVGRMTDQIDTITLRDYLERVRNGDSGDFAQLYLINNEYRSLDEKTPVSLNDNVVEPGYGASTQFPSSVIFLYIKVSEDQAYIDDGKRFTAVRITQDGFVDLPAINLSGCVLPHHKQAVTRGRSNAFMVTVHYGYMESPDLTEELRTLQHRLGIPDVPRHWGRFVDRLTIEPASDLRFLQYAEVLIFSRMRRWTSPIYDYYGLSKIGTVHGVRLVYPMRRRDFETR